MTSFGETQALYKNDEPVLLIYITVVEDMPDTSCVPPFEELLLLPCAFHMYGVQTGYLKRESGHC